MNDRTPPKSKSKSKGVALPGPKLVAKDIKPGIGHNSDDGDNAVNNNGEKHPEVIKLTAEIMELQKQRKAIASAERDIRNRLKREFNILASSVTREVSLRKLDPDVRVQVETNHEDYKRMLGYQPSLDFTVDGAPTEASVKAQPSEKALDKRNTEPQRTIRPTPEGSGFRIGLGLATDDDEDENDVDVDEKNVITREG